MRNTINTQYTYSPEELRHGLSRAREVRHLTASETARALDWSRREVKEWVPDGQGSEVLLYVPWHSPGLALSYAAMHGGYSCVVCSARFECRHESFAWALRFFETGFEGCLHIVRASPPLCPTCESDHNRYLEKQWAGLSSLFRENISHEELDKITEAFSLGWLAATVSLLVHRNARRTSKAGCA